MAEKMNKLKGVKTEVTQDDESYGGVLTKTENADDDVTVKKEAMVEENKRKKKSRKRQHDEENCDKGIDNETENSITKIGEENNLKLDNTAVTVNSAEDIKSEKKRTKKNKKSRKRKLEEEINVSAGAGASDEINSDKKDGEHDLAENKAAAVNTTEKCSKKIRKSKKRKTEESKCMFTVGGDSSGESENAKVR